MPITFAPGAEPTPFPVLPEIPDDGSVHVIRLNRGMYAIIDVADKPLINGWRFSTGQHNENRCGNVRWDVIAYRGTRSDKTRETLFLHTLITQYEETDHINGNTFDNRRENLRAATASQNQHNQTLRANNVTGYKGVSWHKQREKFRTRIMVNGHERHLGAFDSAIDAALAYDMAAREDFGIFAMLNFPIAGERSAITGELRPMITA